MLTGSSFQTFESRNEWQRAWARYRTGNSPVDYVRPTGSGIDPLLLNVTQTRRPGRGWWRMLLDQYGAADVDRAGSASEAALSRRARRSAPSSPATAPTTGCSASSRCGSRTAPRSRACSTRASAASTCSTAGPSPPGQLTPDPSLIVPEPPLVEEIEEEEATRSRRPQPAAAAARLHAGRRRDRRFGSRSTRRTRRRSAAAELAVSRVPGVTSAFTTSPSVGGTSAMRVSYMGDAGGARRRARGAGLAGRPARATTLRAVAAAATDVAQIALPLDWPVADRDEDFLISDCQPRRLRASQALVGLAGHGDLAHRARANRAEACSAGSSSARPAAGCSTMPRIMTRRRIFHAWNEAQQSRRPLLIVADAPPPLWQVTLPDLRSRLAATPHVAIGEPDDALIGDLIVKLLGDRGIAVPPEVPAFICAADRTLLCRRSAGRRRARPRRFVASPPHNGGNGAARARRKAA